MSDCFSNKDAITMMDDLSHAIRAIDGFPFREVDRHVGQALELSLSIADAETNRVLWSAADTCEQAIDLFWDAQVGFVEAVNIALDRLDSLKS